MYKVDPRVCTLVCNLLASDALRRALLDEPLRSGPKVPLVIKPASLACRAERLAWAGTGPERAIVRPSGSSCGVRPDSTSSEEMDLRIPGKVIWCNVTDIPFVHDARRDHAGLDGLAYRLRRKRIDLIVEGRHAAPAKAIEAEWSRPTGARSRSDESAVP
nr:hypothetical protein [Novosphingobium sp. JCM 18896]